ncbi:MAG: sensor histidine kinase [Holophagaceae bacterium]|nr:sensor histidine kinase [Holophagaceae bacterium]
MRCTDVFSSLYGRIFKGSRPLALLIVGILLCVIHALSAPFHINLPLVLVTLIAPFALLGIAPLPWQWTGDDASKATFPRGLLQALIVGGIWMGLIVLYLYFWGPSIAHDQPHAAQRAGRLGLGGFAFVATIGFGWVLAEMEDREAQQRATAKLLRESQCRALQSQLAPHVLYNALNSLAGLIQEDQEAAEEVVILLADLYRMLAKQGGATRIPLGEERRLVEAYLVMEQMRLGERLKTRWVWAEGEDQVTVPPLVLQPLVENAIKHGISPTLEGGELIVTYAREGQGHRLQVANTGRAPDRDAPKGVGLGNLEARLALWPDMDGTLAFLRQGDWTLATLRWIPKGVL